MVITKTKGGSPVTITHEFPIGQKPVHGAWWSEQQQEWIPASWSLDGKYFPDREISTLLDLDIIDFEKRR